MTLEQLIDERVRLILAERDRQEKGRELERLLYTVPEAARRTSISAERLREWIEAGKLPRRVKNPDAKRSVYLVSLDEIREASAGAEPEASPVDLAAARILRRAR